MFKLTGSSGRRNASPGGGVSQASRVSGLTQLRQGPAPVPHRPAFVPDSLQESTFDSNSPRLSGLEKIA